MTSYQKLKNKNEELMQDLHDTIMYPDTQTGIRVKMKWHHFFQSNFMTWENKIPDNAQPNYKGLISQITPKK